MSDDVTVTVSLPKDSRLYQQLVEDARANGVSVADMLVKRANDWFKSEEEARGAQAEANADAALDYWE